MSSPGEELGQCRQPSGSVRNGSKIDERRDGRRVGSRFRVSLPENLPEIPELLAPAFAVAKAGPAAATPPPTAAATDENTHGPRLRNEANGPRGDAEYSSYAF